ncbi:MAG TPA: phosphoribosylglycinamide formyltransferase [Tepidisphaeraceae bacterium]|nr:phosphoribosylglycinamide formyltransferase [Tepidisphaeraceae bacterium]
MAILASGSGRTLQNFIDLIARGELPAEISVVIGSKAGLGALDRAATAKIPHHLVSKKEHASAAAHSAAIFKLVDEAKVDLICLAGWLCLLDIPRKYEGRIMNIHPALLPSFGGHRMFGHHVHEAVLAAGCKVSGCTVHFVDEKYDNGPIILQRCCAVMENDTPDTLAARVFEEEKIAYPEAVRLFVENRLRIEGRRVRVLPPGSAT